MSKVICTDLDDTLALTGKSILSYAEKYNIEYLKKHRNFYNKGLYRDYWYFALGYQWDDEDTISFLDKYYPRYLLNLEVVEPSISEILNDISKMYEIYVITSRKEISDRKIYNLTLDWLNKNNLKVDGLYVDVKNKGEILNKIKPEYYIDDSFDNCKVAFKMGINSIMYTTPYNYNLKSGEIKKVNSWVEVLDIVKY